MTEKRKPKQPDVRTLTVGSLLTVGMLLWDNEA